MHPRDAVDAVLADMRDHRITADGTGLFNATRHIGLLCHLAAGLAADTEYQLAPNSRGLPPAETLAQSAGHLGRAIAHYTQALTPLVCLATPGAQDTLQKQLDALDHHSRLRVHLDHVGVALKAVRVGLDVPHRPVAASPSATAPVPVPAAQHRRRA
ncbi:hypothetical protein [Streptomyces sp. CBMA152]|uniref:hypothetical protein n=1 Tax=Streptomyces sp. CBMA152 TaxID=1896312 RepID=UPI0016607EF0|nr:hypothetical protein [Streptomyces sp. CBMA152]